jgi:hypothetical protein
VVAAIRIQSLHRQRRAQRKALESRRAHARLEQRLSALQIQRMHRGRAERRRVKLLHPATTSRAAWPTIQYRCIEEFFRQDRSLQDAQPRHYFFLGHRQAEANYQIAELHSIFQDRLGMNCWRDLAEKKVDVNAMIRGVAESAVYLLYLTKESYTYYVSIEARVAMMLGKPLVLLLENDRRHHGYAGGSVEAAIKDWPQDLKSYFDRGLIVAWGGQPFEWRKDDQDAKLKIILDRCADENVPAPGSWHDARGKLDEIHEAWVDVPVAPPPATRYGIHGLVPSPKRPWFPFRRTASSNELAMIRHASISQPHEPQHSNANLQNPDVQNPVIPAAASGGRNAFAEAVEAGNHASRQRLSRSMPEEELRRAAMAHMLLAGENVSKIPGLSKVERVTIARLLLAPMPTRAEPAGGELTGGMRSSCCQTWSEPEQDDASQFSAVSTV